MTLLIASNFGKHCNIQNSFIAGEDIIDQFDFHVSFYIRDICYYYIFNKYNFSLSFNLKSNRGMVPAFGTAHYKISSFMNYKLQYFVNDCV